MTFSQKSDVKKHLAHSLKKTHYLTPEDQSRPAEKVDESSINTGSSATLLDDRESFHVGNTK
jgi:hypothetical protein